MTSKGLDKAAGIGSPLNDSAKTKIEAEAEENKSKRANFCVRSATRLKKWMGAQERRIGSRTQIRGEWHMDIISC